MRRSIAENSFETKTGWPKKTWFCIANLSLAEDSAGEIG
jgi:hypothetical protein